MGEDAGGEGSVMVLFSKEGSGNLEKMKGRGLAGFEGWLLGERGCLGWRLREEKGPLGLWRLVRGVKEGRWRGAGL